MSGRHHRAHGFIADAGWYAIRCTEHPNGEPDRTYYRTAGRRTLTLADRMAVRGYRVRVETIACTLAELEAERLKASRIDFIADGHQVTIDAESGPARFIRVGKAWRSQTTGDRFTSVALHHYARRAGGFRLEDHQGPSDAVRGALAAEATG